MRNFKYLQKMFFLLVMTVSCAGFMACDSDDPEPGGGGEGGETSELISTLKQYKWYNSYTSYDDDGYRYHSEVRYIVFMDNNVGYYYGSHTYKGNETHRSRFLYKITYSVSGNTVTTYDTETGSTSVYTYVSGYLQRGEDSFWEPQELTQSDKEYIEDELMYMDLTDNIDDYVSIDWTNGFVKEDKEYVFNVTIKTELPQRYPKKSFKYFMDVYEDGYYREDITFTGNSISFKIVLNSIYTYDYLYMQELVENGQVLSDESKKYLKEITEGLEDDIRDFYACISVKVNDKEFILEEEIQGYENLNPKYEPDGYQEEEEEEEEEEEDVSGTINGHEWVDLGLSVKWATCNVGASSPEEYGDYYAWGETTIKSNYTSDNSTTYGLSTSALKSRGIIGSDGNLTASYDAATANWGGSWRIPTLDEIKELVNNCTWTWTSQSGVKGRKVTGPNGNSIFLPAAGYRYGSDLDFAGTHGWYWSATPNSNSGSACFLYFYSDNYYWNPSNRYNGFAVRPVSE